MQSTPHTWIYGPEDGPLPLVAAAVSADYLGEETALVRRLLAMLCASQAFRRRVHRAAVELVERMRAGRHSGFGIDALMREYDLSSKEGIVLMCLAEALLRIPDAETADRLIADKIGAADWASHLDAEGSVFVNASTWALMLTGRILRDETSQHRWTREIAQLVNRLGEPVIRTALRQAMRVLGHQFVMGRTIEDALERAGREPNARYRYSFDMLGEA
ncbi:MAG TPA: bifunctional proline dehydrogenase/L-glutamate gamma-semialdehyde dehydrogenase, partial [Gammaproteobacteria bacterium]|nr:bifunctional proline dehydrogenase/L-glutamate gamma-semialdehyde dehydrogenase [Gammaproteobacteria bacterium]